MALPPLLPDPSTWCVQLTTAPGEVCVEFPGGFRICATQGFDEGDLSKIVQSLLGNLGPGLAALNPLLTVFDTLKAVFDCVTAVPDAILSLNPQPIVECLVQLGKQIDKILKMYPPMPILVMVKGILETVLLGLMAIRQRLQAMIAQAARIAAAASRAAALAQLPGGSAIAQKLQLVADCGSSNMEAQLQNMQAGMAPLNRLIQMINTLLQLVNLDCIPVFSAPLEVSTDALAPLDAAIELLQFVLEKIPTSVVLPGLPAAGKC